MKIEVSTAEVVDKYTILQLKSERISDEEKLKNIRYERDLLSKSLIEKGHNPNTEPVKALYSVNGLIWDVEDRLRAKESKREFDDDFTLLARFVYILNDRRAEIKRGINLDLNSKLVEEKSYEAY